MAVAATLVIAAFAATAVEAHGSHSQQHPIYWTAALAFGGFIAFGELLRLALPGGREAAPIAMVGAMSYALLLALPKHGNAKQSALLVIAVAAVGMTVGALPHIAAGRPAGITGMCARIVAVACVAFIFRPLVPMAFKDRPWELALRDHGAARLLRLADRHRHLGPDPGRRRRRPVLRRDAGRDTPAVAAWPGRRAPRSSSRSSAPESMGLGVLAVFTGPLLVTQVAFRRYAGIRATYLQTVRSLARVTEVAGYVETGHSRRVSRLAVSVGRGLGMTEPDLLALEYAALMHDIGQLSLRDPIPGGATVLVSAADQDRIAELGADVIGEAGVLD